MLLGSGLAVTAHHVVCIFEFLLIVVRLRDNGGSVMGWGAARRVE